MRTRPFVVFPLALAALVASACGAPDPGDLEVLGETSQPLCMVERQFQGRGAPDSPIGPFPWSTGVVPYTFDAEAGFAALTENERDLVRAAMASWTNATGGAITFRPKVGGDTKFLIIDKNTNAPAAAEPGGGVMGWFSDNNRGHIAFGQVGRAAAAHELGHALSMSHHQQRADRDTYLTMNPAGIGHGNGSNCQDAPDQYNQTYTKVPADETYGVFDFSSIMLYTGHTSTATGYTRKDGSLVFGWESGGGNATFKDGSAVLETMNKPNGWGRFKGPDVSRGGDLNFNRTFGASAVYATGTPGVCYRKDATPVLLRTVTGTDQRLWLKEGGASNWTRLGTTLSNTNPSCASWGAGRVDVVVKGTDNLIYKIGHQGGVWENGPTSIGAPPFTPSAPAIAAWGANRLDVFVIANGSIYTKNWNGSAWSAWAVPRGNPAGVTMTGIPGAASEASGKLAVAARDTDGKLHLLEYANTTWGNWTEIGSASGSGVGSPGIASWGADRLDIVVRGSGNNFVWQKARSNGSWFGWYPMGGVLSQPPAIAAATSNKLDIVALTQDNATFGGVWEKQWRPL